jgi:hypothetical protein
VPLGTIRRGLPSQVIVSRTATSQAARRSAEVQPVDALHRSIVDGSRSHQTARTRFRDRSLLLKGCTAIFGTRSWSQEHDRRKKWTGTHPGKSPRAQRLAEFITSKRTPTFCGEVAELNGRSEGGVAVDTSRFSDLSGRISGTIVRTAEPVRRCGSMRIPSRGSPAECGARSGV